MTVTAGRENDRALLTRIAEHGVVGAGGAGFPTHLKLARSAGTVILNAAECEPLMHKDKEILRHFGPQVIEGLKTAARLVGAREIVVGIKAKAVELVALVEKLLGGTGRVLALADSYPTGDELILVHDATGRIVPPGGIPLDVGVVVINVETAFDIGRDEPVTETFLTAAGAVARPCTVRVPVGLSFGEVVQAAGGASTDDPCYLSGGVMMGRLVSSSDPVPKTCGGVVVLPHDHPVVVRYRRDWRTIARIGASACDQCTLCTELCPRYLLGHPIEPHKAMRALGFVADREPLVAGSAFCCECNLCTMIACPEDLDPGGVCAHSKRGLGSRQRPWRPDAHPYRAEVHLDDRRVPTGRLIRKLGLHAFRDVGPLREGRLTATRVCLSLAQRSGPPAVAIVVEGERVRRGQVVARPGSGAPGRVIHASIDGFCRVNSQAIEITAERPRGGHDGASRQGDRG